MYIDLLDCVRRDAMMRTWSSFLRVEFGGIIYSYGYGLCLAGLSKCVLWFVFFEKNSFELCQKGK